jgi:hypothetical protein
MTSDPRFAKFQCLNLIFGFGCAALFSNTCENCVLVITLNVATLVPDVWVFSFNSFRIGSVEHRPLGLLKRSDTVFSVVGLDRNSSSQLIGPMEDGGDFVEFNFF